MLAADSRFEDASAAYGRALENDSLTPTFRAVTRDNLGYCLIALDRSAEGLEMVHEAFTFLERENARAYTVVPLMDLCFGYLKVDRFAEARYFGEEGLQRAPILEDASVEKNLLYLLGEACHLGGDTPAAQVYFDRLAALYPEFRNLRAYLEVFDFRNVINLRSS
jgi:tetratricopeptide (TPR) repeat protein